MIKELKKQSISPRLQSLREAYLKVTPSLSIDRVLAFTEAAKETGFELPANLRIAKGFRRKTMD